MYNTGYPWLTKKAVEFLDDYLTEDMYVLEFGSGASTKWIAERVEFIKTIESDPDYYDIIKSKRIVNCEHVLTTEAEAYPGEWDLILIDGRKRVESFKKNIQFLKKGGVLMLDNSEREDYKEIIKALRKWEKYETSGPDYTGTFDYPDWKTTWWIK